MPNACFKQDFMIKEQMAEFTNPTAKSKPNKLYYDKNIPGTIFLLSKLLNLGQLGRTLHDIRPPAPTKIKRHIWTSVCYWAVKSTEQKVCCAKIPGNIQNSWLVHKDRMDLIILAGCKLSYWPGKKGLINCAGNGTWKEDICKAKSRCKMFHGNVYR